MSFWIYKGKIYEREDFRLVPGFPDWCFSHPIHSAHNLSFQRENLMSLQWFPTVLLTKSKGPCCSRPHSDPTSLCPTAPPLKFLMVHTSFLTRPHILWPLGFCTCCSLLRAFLPPPLLGSLLLTLHEYLPKFDLVPCASPSQHSSL